MLMRSESKIGWKGTHNLDQMTKQQSGSMIHNNGGFKKPQLV